MEIRVLGCHGAQLPGYNTTAFLLDDKLLVDAGTITSLLTIEEQSRIDHILITHAHLDHVKDIAFLADNLHMKKAFPIEVVSTHSIINVLRENIFNNVIWPDFSVIPSPEEPVLRFCPIELGCSYSLDHIHVSAIRVHHAIETVAFVIEYAGGSVIFVGDTGPTDEIWSVANTLQNLKAIFIEVSFPNEMKEVAEAAGHLTPASFRNELGKLRRNSPDIYLYHLKPQYQHIIEKEVDLLDKKNVRILKEGEVIQI